ncbi:MAG: UDP-N-acetyl-D-mannosamine dehydrogenase [Bacteroidales bacterium]|nr:UDP-N-acetyl-D-mannosamine dehydrogenase [Bacteroidales bacterium]
MSKTFSKVVMTGLGYIGLPTAAIIAKNKINVLGVDISEKVVNTINQGKIHIVEPELDGLVKNVIETGYLKAAMRPEQADVFLIAVPTPFKENFIPDISYVEAATRSIIPFLKEEDLFIIESTSPIGTTEKMADIIYTEKPELKDKIYIAYCPERVLPGNVIYELVNNDRVIGGLDKISAEIAAGFYANFVQAKLHQTNARTAEMCKLVENSSRDVSIAFANELSMICDKAGINVWELIELSNKHPRVNILQPGTGVGGHCIAVDPWFIVADFREEARIIRTAREINNFKTQWVVEKVKNTILEYKINKKAEPKVAVMGLAFKPNIDDLRESPAIIVANELMEYKNASYAYVEPNVESHSKFPLTDYKTAYNEADIVVFLVAHKEFLQLDKSSIKVELDLCGVRK